MTKETREITHAEAKEIASRLIRSAWRRDGEPYESGRMMVAHIPARPDLDDDLLIHEYIRQQAERPAAGRYIAFAFNHYYPDGGVNDLVGFFDSLDEVIPAVVAKYPSWSMDAVHIIDAWQGKVTVFKGRSLPGYPPVYVLDEDWKGDEVRGGTDLIEVPIQTA